MIAIIGARGGSKGLPGKNIRPLHGKPLIAYSIEAAKGSKAIDRVILSTDSEEIAEVGARYGAEIPFLRPAELAQDQSLAMDAYVYTIDRLNESRPADQKIDELAVLQPTSPFRTSADIDAAVKIFRDKNADSVIGVFPAPHPVQWYRYVDNDGVLRSFFPDIDPLKNRQDQKASYLPNGAMFLFKYRLLKDLRTYYTDKTYPYVMPATRSIDIDTIDDFEWAEFFWDKHRAR